MVKVKVRQRGGQRLAKLLREAGKGGVKSVQVGFFSTAKYEDGTPVAAVAAWNEFGTKNIPERPFFRQAVAEMEDGVADVIKAGIDTKKMVVDRNLAGRVGQFAASQVQERITDLEEPPNAPATVERKGSSSPLLDTGFMRASVDYEVKK